MAQNIWKRLPSQSLLPHAEPSGHRAFEWVLMIAAELATITLHLSVVVHVALTVFIHAPLHPHHRLR